MKKVLVLAVFLLFAYNLGAEAFEGACADEAACCVCLCQAPSIKPVVTQLKQQPQTTEFVKAPNTLTPEALFDKSFFHPPEIA